MNKVLTLVTVLAIWVLVGFSGHARSAELPRIPDGLVGEWCMEDASACAAGGVPEPMVIGPRAMRNVADYEADGVSCSVTKSIGSNLDRPPSGWISIDIDCGNGKRAFKGAVRWLQTSVDRLVIATKNQRGELGALVYVRRGTR
jgi:hypothetical protein